MPRREDFNAKPVFSSDEGQIDRAKARPGIPEGDGVVRVRRETGGRGGKTVTTVRGVPLLPDELKKLAKVLKQACGTGGSSKDGVIEIQGDHREKIKDVLEKRGMVVKLAGG